jgi:hypothetical protein
MRFLLDENVPRAVGDALRELGHDVRLSTDLVAVGSPDQVVATAAVQDDRILVSHDRDMRRIDRIEARGARDRYRNLNRLLLSCEEPRAAERVRAFMSVVQADFDYLPDGSHERMFFDIGDRRARIFR